VQSLIEKAAVLVEALPWIRRLTDKTVVIKYGGHAMTDAALRASFAVDVVLLKYIGVRPVIVHGGGPQIDATLERMGRRSSFVHGRRVTDDDTMAVVEMILGGTINQEIVGLVQQGGGRAIGITGRDGGMLQVRRKLMDGRDLGRVGEVLRVDPSVVRDVSQAGYVPVIAPLGVGEQDGLTYNVNADEAAGHVAAALRAEKLILLTDVEGVKSADGTLLSSLTAAEVRKLVQEGAIQGGMIPKVECCVDALAGGVSRSHIIDGRILHAVLLEIFTDGGVGTLIGA